MVLDFVRSRLPPAVADQVVAAIFGLLGLGGPQEGDGAGLGGMLGGWLGKR